MAVTLFISDLHLDDSRPQATEAFLQFLESEARGADALFILGDLFEYWLGDDAPTRTGLSVAEGLRRLTGRGVACRVLHGNRDFLLGPDFARRCGMELLPEQVAVDLYGRPTLLLHGDTLCTDDTGYQEIRRIVRDPAWQAEFLARSPAERVRFALEAREMSAEYKKGVAPDIMDVNADAVEQAFLEHGLRHMIHGHTHRPAIHAHEVSGNAAERIVLGDWYEQGSVLRVSPDGADLAALPFSPDGYAA